jgi:hypothetical protein
MSFPSSPVDGQSAVLNSVTYNYSATLGAWTRAGVNAGTVRTGTAPPSGAMVGDLWFNTSTNATYRWTFDGTSYYWIDTTGGSDNFFSSANVLTISSTVKSTSTSTGALVVLGGVGISGEVYTGGNVITSGYIIANSITGTRINPRAQSVVTDPSSITPTGDTADLFAVTALDAATVINAPSGTPVNGQNLTLRIKDNGSSQTLTWNPIYRTIGTTLPGSTSAGKVVYVILVYNAQDSTWDVLSVDRQA